MWRCSSHQDFSWHFSTFRVIADLIIFAFSLGVQPGTYGIWLYSTGIVFHIFKLSMRWNSLCTAISCLNPALCNETSPLAKPAKDSLGTFSNYRKDTSEAVTVFSCPLIITAIAFSAQTGNNANFIKSMLSCLQFGFSACLSQVLCRYCHKLNGGT